MSNDTKTTMDNLFANLMQKFVDDIVNGLLNSEDDIRELKKEELSSKILKLLNLQSLSVTKEVASVRGIAAARESASSSKKQPKVSPLWLTLDDLRSKYGSDLKTANICMFASPRGAHNKKICGQPAVPECKLDNPKFTGGKEYLGARCATCAGKIGQILKLMDGTESSRTTSHANKTIEDVNQLSRQDKKKGAKDTKEEEDEITVKENQSLTALFKVPVYVTANDDLNNVIIVEVDGKHFFIGYTGETIVDEKTVFTKESIMRLKSFDEMIRERTGPMKEASKKMFEIFGLEIMPEKKINNLLND